MPTGTPAYLSIDAAGRVTATFDGVIVGRAGSTVPADTITGQLGDSQVAALSAAKLLGQLTDGQIATLAAAKLTGQITDAQIAQLAAAKISGQLTDAQLSVIAAAKVSGQLTDAQLAAISASKLTGLLNGTTQIAPGSITTGLLAANAIVAGKIAANSINGDKISLPASTSNSPLGSDQVEWVNGGAIISAAQAFDSALGVPSSALAALVGNPNGSRNQGVAQLVAAGLGKAHPSSLEVVANPLSGLNSVDGRVNNQSFTIMDDGASGDPPTRLRSSFMKIAGGLQDVTIAWTGMILTVPAQQLTTPLVRWNHGMAGLTGYYFVVGTETLYGMYTSGLLYQYDAGGVSIGALVCYPAGVSASPRSCAVWCACIGTK